MDFLGLAKRRYSVRKYQGKKVEEEKLMRILEAGRVAPTGANTQPQRILVIKEKEGLEKLSKSANVYGAPVAIITCVDHSAVWKRPFDKKKISDIDVTIVTDHMMLEATAQGLGTVWICYFDPQVIKKEFNLPESFEPVNILAVGYAEGEAASPDRHDKARKPLEDIVFYESF
ncbi:nitroreductase family protein [Clostridium sp. CX1]|uniref:Nitroreductase family protein n=1 Tax=Clostridium tanneri TaxID=3037988 RepID=A0ABU4JW61_9CLOT|nr:MULTISPECIES: nitroreductase family protein [unclassified Clostridium]MCT8975200.1 nitroreductase family protein [Clostridium sp. CX1]MDW8802163.1 nitroreductase family protein [Clostridium sp. A1-XYC3]